ncbi:MAG: acyltransferase [Dysosmobacter welbionis]
MQTLTQRRSVPVDAAKTAAIFGTLLIHASAAGGFAGAPGSFGWTSALFWNCLLRSAVPVFFLCSGALLLPPEKEVTVRRVWTKYIPRILAALLFWAAAYEGVELLRGWRAAGVLERTALRQAALNLVLFHHKNHLYYLHIILLVYAVLPLTRRLVAAADRRLLNYALGIWFVLGCLAPTLKFFPPLSLVGGIPAQYPINLTWCAVGYGVLGDVLTQEAPRHRPRTFVWLYLAGTALTFGLTLAASRQNRGAVSGVPPGERPRRLFAGGGAVRLLRRPVAGPGPLAHGGDRLQGVLLHLLDAPVLPGLPGGQGPLRRDAAARLGRAGAGGRGLRGRLSGVAGPPAGAGGENLSDLRRKLCCMPFAPRCPWPCWAWTSG